MPAASSIIAGGAAVAGLGMQAMQGGDGGGGGVGYLPTLESQKAIRKKLARWLLPQVGEELETWGPTAPLEPGQWDEQWWAPTGPLDWTAYDLTQQYATQPYDYQFEQYLPQLLEGISPEATEDWYNEYIMPARRRILEQEVLPGVREAFVGTGTFRGSPRMEAEARTHETWGLESARQLGETIMQRRAAAESMVPIVAALEQQLAGEPLQRAQAAYVAEERLRLLRTTELQARLQEFLRTRPEYSPIIDMAFRYIGMPLQSAYGIPQQGATGLSALGPQLLDIGAMFGGQRLGAGGGGGMGPVGTAGAGLPPSSGY